MSGLVRILEIAPPDGEFCFGPGRPRIFQERDWFRDDEYDMMETIEGRKQIEEFVRGKKYFSASKAYPILHERHSFTIGYSPP